MREPNSEPLPRPSDTGKSKTETGTARKREIARLNGLLKTVNEMRGRATSGNIKDIHDWLPDDPNRPVEARATSYESQLERLSAEIELAINDLGHGIIQPQNPERGHTTLYKKLIAIQTAHEPEHF